MYGSEAYSEIPYASLAGKGEVTLTGNSCSQQNECSTGAIVGLTNLHGLNCSQTNLAESGSLAGQALNLIGSSCIQPNNCTSGQIFAFEGIWGYSQGNINVWWTEQESNI